MKLALFGLDISCYGVLLNGIKGYIRINDLLLLFRFYGVENASSRQFNSFLMTFVYNLLKLKGSSENPYGSLEVPCRWM
jgi:hypothetical protein